MGPPVIGGVEADGGPPRDRLSGLDSAVEDVIVVACVRALVRCLLVVWLGGTTRRPSAFVASLHLLVSHWSFVPVFVSLVWTHAPYILDTDTTCIIDT